MNQKLNTLIKNYPQLQCLTQLQSIVHLHSEIHYKEMKFTKE